MRHNEICDLTATLLTEVAPNVQIETELHVHVQQVIGEDLTGASAGSHDEAKLDTRASAEWEGRFERTFFDV